MFGICSLAAYALAMAIKYLLAFVSVSLLISCETTSAYESTSQARPVFPQFRAGDPNRLKLSTSFSGRLTRRGPCLGLITDDRFTTIIWPETAQLSMDRRGLLLTDSRSGARLRLGDYLKGTGGPLPRGYQQPLGETVLREGFDLECARYPGYDGWIGIVNAGFRKAIGR